MVTISRNAPRSVDPGSEPGHAHYTVRPGDTMSGIARERGLTLEALIGANPQVRDPAIIVPGQVLAIPASSTTPVPRPASQAPSVDTTVAAPDQSMVTASRARAAAQAATQAASVRGSLDAQVPASSGTLRSALTSTGTLRRHDTGPAIVELQQQLNLRGARLVVDGTFGADTHHAVRRFQRKQGMPADGVVGQDTRAAFAATASRSAPATAPTLPPLPVRGVLRTGSSGSAVEALQARLNNLTGAGLALDGDFGRRTRTAVENFQRRTGLEVDGEVGGATRRALDEVAAGTRNLAAPTALAGIAPAPRPDGPRSRTVAVEGATFRVHDLVRSEFGTRSVPGSRIISLDANSASGRAGEILRPLVVIPNNATRAERAAAQAAADRVALWLATNNPTEGRATTGLVRTTAQNGRGIGGFFHTEFHSVNDTAAVALIRERPQEYARLLAGTLGSIPGANFIVPHGNPSRHGPDPGAVAVDGTSEVDIARFVVRQGFFGL